MRVTIRTDDGRDAEAICRGLVAAVRAEDSPRMMSYWRSLLAILAELTEGLPEGVWQRIALNLLGILFPDGADGDRQRAAGAVEYIERGSWVEAATTGPEMASNSGIRRTLLRFVIGELLKRIPALLEAEPEPEADEA